MADTEGQESPLVPFPRPEHTNPVPAQDDYYDPTSQADLGPYKKRPSGKLGRLPIQRVTVSMRMPGNMRRA